MSAGINNQVKVTTTEAYTVAFDGYEPITGLIKESEWHGWWALKHTNGGEVLLRGPEPGYANAFSDLLGMPRDSVVLAVSPSLLVPLKPGATP